MNNRLKITLFTISIAIFGYHMFHLFYLWPNIPERIAIHFTGSGTADNWGSKYFLLAIPVLSILIWLFIGFLVKRPEKMNYINLTEANKEIQYKRMEIVMLLLQNVSFIAFILINEAMLRNAVGMASELPFYLALILLAICVVAPFYLLIWSATLKY